MQVLTRGSKPRQRSLGAGFIQSKIQLEHVNVRLSENTEGSPLRCALRQDCGPHFRPCCGLSQRAEPGSRLLPGRCEQPTQRQETRGEDTVINLVEVSR